MTGHKLTLLIAPLVLMLALSGQVWCDQQLEDEADVSVTIPGYMHVEVGNIAEGWGRGLTYLVKDDKGVPQAIPNTDPNEPSWPGPGGEAFNGGDGTDPTWSGGSLSGPTYGDHWPHDNYVSFCHGATNRTPITVSSNLGSVYVSIPLNDIHASQLLPWALWSGAKNASPSLQASMVLGYVQAGAVKPGWHRQYTDLYGTDTTTWLYAVVQRKGLTDAAGTYSNTVTVTATNQ